MALTPSQSAQLAELRAHLDDDPTVEINLCQGGEELDDACLRRWLRADRWNVAAAEARLRTHAKWRASFAPSGEIRLVDADVDKVFLHGIDKKGRPCITVAAATFMVSTRDAREVSRSVCSILDLAIQQVDKGVNPDGQLCVIFDLRGVAISSLDTTMLKSIFDMLAQHYPERMGKIYMYDASYLFWGIWKCVSPFIEEGTMRKVVWVYSSDATELQRDFDLDNLPAEFGGRKVRMDRRSGQNPSDRGEHSSGTLALSPRTRAMKAC